MKRKIYSLTVIVLMLLVAVSCSQEDDFKGLSSGGKVTFKVNLLGEAQSRTAGDGKTVTKLYYEVYQGTGNNKKKILDNYGMDANADPVMITDGLASVEMSLKKSEKYDIMFWAEAEGSIYDPTDLKCIKVNYTESVANQEAYDAFYYGEMGFQVSKTETVIEMIRPFGQLNIGTTVTDWKKAQTLIADGDPITASQIKVRGLANRFNVLTHRAYVEDNTEVGEVTFSKTTLLGEKFVVKDTEYQNLAMNYLLIPTNVIPDDEDTHTGNVNITAATFWRLGNEPLFDIKVLNVPVTRNWRTNIVGELLAADKTFVVVVDPIFKGDKNHIVTMN